jgi:hypothetical protein
MNQLKKPTTGAGNIGRGRIERSSHLNSSSYNHSPIKTRFNVRQTLLLNSIKQQQMQLQQQKELEKERFRMQKEHKMKVVGENETLETQEPNDAASLRQRHRLSGKHQTSATIEQHHSSKGNEPINKKPKRMKVSSQSEHKHRIKLMRSQSDNSKQALRGSINQNKNSIKTSTDDLYKNKIHVKAEPTESASETLNNNTQLKLSIPSSFSFDSASSLSQSQADSQYKISAVQQQQNSKQSYYISRATVNNMINPSTSRASCLNIDGQQLILSSNPLYWSTSEVCKYLVENKFDSNLMRLIEEQEIDGQSFLMLTLPTIQNYMNLKLGPAIKLAHLVDKLKFAYFQQFSTSIDAK